MDNELLAVTITVILLMGVVAALAFLMRTRARQQSAALREHFGDEYDRALQTHGSRARAEKELSLRQRRVEQLQIRLLSREQCDKFSQAWSAVQQRFVDDPSGAVVDADLLVKDVMAARGYPVSNFEQRVADLSVEHAQVIHHYRAARDIALANASGRAGTEELRQAMVHYRALFTDLLQSHAAYAPLTEAHV